MLLSIIIPCYNVEKYVDMCHQTLVNQVGVVLGKDYELIFVDDCSKDNTSAHLSKYTETGVSVVKHQKNSGISQARNTGIHHAAGEYVWTVDSDDMVSEKAVSEIIKSIGENKDKTGVHIFGRNVSADSTPQYQLFR